MGLSVEEMVRGLRRGDLAWLDDAFDMGIRPPEASGAPRKRLDLETGRPTQVPVASEGLPIYPQRGELLVAFKDGPEVIRTLRNDELVHVDEGDPPALVVVAEGPVQVGGKSSGTSVERGNGGPPSRHL